MEEQLVEITHAFDAFIRELVPRAACIHASGIDFAEMFAKHEVPPPIRGHQALAGFLQRAKEQGRICGACDPNVVAVEIMGAIHIRHWIRLMAHADDHILAPGPDFVEKLVHNLWSGLAPEDGA